MLMGMAKKGSRREIVECHFECPAKGRFELRVWKDESELATDACWRALKKSKIDAPQIPLCKLVRHRTLP